MTTRRATTWWSFCQTRAMSWTFRSAAMPGQARRTRNTPMAACQFFAAQGNNFYALYTKSFAGSFRPQTVVFIDPIHKRPSCLMISSRPLLLSVLSQTPKRVAVLLRPTSQSELTGLESFMQNGISSQARSMWFRLAVVCSSKALDRHRFKVQRPSLFASRSFRQDR